MPLEPTWAKVTSCRRSPVVLMISISTAWPCVAQQCGNMVGLPKRELRSAAADAQVHRRASTAGRQLGRVRIVVWLLRRRRLSLGRLGGSGSAATAGKRPRFAKRIDARGVVLARGLLQRLHRRMEEFVHQAAGERFNGGEPARR